MVISASMACEFAVVTHYPGTQGKCDVQITAVYLAQISLGNSCIDQHKEGELTAAGLGCALRAQTEINHKAREVMVKLANSYTMRAL